MAVDSLILVANRVALVVNTHYTKTSERLRLHFEYRKVSENVIYSTKTEHVYAILLILVRVLNMLIQYYAS